MIEHLGPVPYGKRLRQEFKEGGLCTVWAEQYPREVAPAPIQDLVIGRMIDEGPQCPDLFVYAEDGSDWFFCDAKGPRDRISTAQRAFFEELAVAAEKPVRILALQEIQ